MNYFWCVLSMRKNGDFAVQVCQLSFEMKFKIQLQKVGFVNVFCSC